MDRLGMVGATCRRRGQALISRLSLPAGPAGDALLLQMHDACSFEESVGIATCNRVEIIFVAAPRMDCAEARRRMWQFWRQRNSQLGGPDAAHHLHAYAGEGAAERLFVVASALDSLHPGDAQVLGQIKDALRRAQRLGTVGPHLAHVFQETFAVAKRVRHATLLGEGSISMLSLARAPIVHRLGARGGPRALAVVGAGAMAEQCGALFAQHPGLDRVFVNRTHDRAVALAQRFGGRAVPLEDFLARPGPLEVVVTATAAPRPLLDAAFLARLPAPLPLMVDLSVHHDVDPAAALARGVELWDIDKLAHLADGNLAARRGQLAAARQIVDAALDGYRRRLLARAASPHLQRLRQLLADSLARDLAAMPDPPLLADGRLDQEAWRASLEAWKERAVGRLAHAPTLGLRALAFAHGIEAVDDFVGAMEARPCSS